MFLTNLKAMLVHAAREVFDAEYPEPDFRGLPVSIEFPVAEDSYPGMWVTFEPTGDLEIVGVAHREYSEAGSGGERREYTRWKYQGHAVYTIVALTSLERDRLFDEMVRVVAFGREAPTTAEFRAYIEDNDLISAYFDWDGITPSGITEAPGTPWGTDDMIYEASIRMGCWGEFVSTLQSTGPVLVPLSEIRVQERRDDEEDPTANEPGWR